MMWLIVFVSAILSTVDSSLLCYGPSSLNGVPTCLELLRDQGIAHGAWGSVVWFRIRGS